LETPVLFVEPFPHIILLNALSVDDLKQVQCHWPEYDKFVAEPGGLGRSWCDLVIEDNWTDTSLLDEDNSFWRNFITETLHPIYEMVHAALGPLAKHRYGFVPDLRLQQLTLMQSEPEFSVHPAHKHFQFAPEWVFTTLIQIDDAGNEGRGSRLYKYPGMREVINGPPKLQAEFALTQFPECDAALDIPFRPGQMVAISEGPWCIHGSTPGIGPGPRRIIRCHARIDRQEAAKSYGCEPGNPFTAHLGRIASGEIKSGQTVDALKRDISAPKLWPSWFAQ